MVNTRGELYAMMTSLLVVGIILFGKVCGETTNHNDISNTEILSVLKIIQGDIAKLETRVKQLDGRVNNQGIEIKKNLELIHIIADNAKEARIIQAKEIHYIKEKLDKQDQRKKDVVEIKKILRGEPWYVYVGEKATWLDAEEHCKKLGGHLATITSQLSNTHLFYDAMQSFRFGVERFWIGYNDIKREGKFEWINGESNNFTDWGPGQPDQRREENCVSIDHGVKGWHDYSCQHPMPYVCQLHRCHGVNDGCCSSETPCDEDDGDCDKDSDCKGDLRCGTDNCTWGGRGDDCCIKLAEQRANDKWRHSLHRRH